MQSVCKVRSRLEGFLGRFFLVQLVFWLQALSGPGVHGGTGHHEASRGFMAAQASTAAQDITGLHGGAGHHGASQGLTGLMASPGAPQRPGVHCASLELHSQAAHFGPGT